MSLNDNISVQIEAKKWTVIPVITEYIIIVSTRFDTLGEIFQRYTVDILINMVDASSPVITDIIAVIIIGRCKYGIEPYHINAQTFNIIQFGNDPF